MLLLTSTHLPSLSLLCFLTSLFGFYVYNLTRHKKKGTTPDARNRAKHRLLGNFFVLTTLLYSFSGAWHSFHKVLEKDKTDFYDRSSFSRNELDLPLPEIMKGLDTSQRLTDVSIVKIEERNYWQVSLRNGKEKQKRYLSTKGLKELKGGDIAYGEHLATRFSGKPAAAITHHKLITAFNHQYSMMNKRLPVVEIGFKGAESYWDPYKMGADPCPSGW